MLDEVFLSQLNIGKAVKPEQYSPLTLAYVGDCVYELYIRTFLIKDANMQVEKLHKRAIGYVSAGAQAKFFHQIEELLSENELAIFKRGRNAKSSVPKNADLADYKTATGLETLFGYLYISGNENRLVELLSHIQ